MTDFTQLPISDLLKPGGYECGACGRRHDAPVRGVFIEHEAIYKRLTAQLAAMGGKKPFIVADRNTDRAAGQKVRAILDGAGIKWSAMLLANDETEPDEHAVGQAAMAFDSGCDCILAVGSGVINDVCKVIAAVSGKPYISVATAPSMDGYASNSSSMIVNGLKTTLYTTCPFAIIADTAILKEAPMIMLYSGLGDVLGKYISVCEWRIAHEVLGEYYCGHIAQLMRNALKKCRQAAPGLAERDEAAVAAVTEGLILAGIAMSYARVSRPASGLEHYFSHIWDMSTLEKGTPGSRHGVQVAIGTVLSLRVYDMLKSETPSREIAQKCADAFSVDAWEADMRRILPKAGENIIEVEKTARKNDMARHAARLDAVLSKWERIVAIMNEELPDSQSIESLLRGIGAPVLPGDIGISAQLTRDAFIASREIRDKYIASSLLWDIGLLDKYADRLCAGLS